MVSLSVKFYLCIYILFSCSNHHSPKNNPGNLSSEKLHLIAGNFSPPSGIQFDSSNILTFLKKYPKLKSIQNEIDSFYHLRNFSFAWYDSGGLVEQAANLYNHIDNIGGEGLFDQLAYKKEFEVLMDNEISDSLNIELELMLTAQYFQYAKAVWGGLSKSQTNNINWYLQRKSLPFYQLLDSLLNGKDLLNTPPVYMQYTLLKKELKKYVDIKAKGGFPSIDSIKRVMKKGDSSLQINAIRKWLFLSGDLSKIANNNVFDDDLEKAVIHFQHRFGLKEDGFINKAMIDQMNVPVEQRMEQIMVNMERSRWVPLNPISNYIVINIPAYKLYNFEKDSLVWSMDVVVGKTDHKTAIFSGKIQTIVFCPYWNIPPGILKNEILPGIRRNRNYLAKHDMEWHDGNVRQRPGANNSLGLIKFLFPNSFNIYLHDTPAKSLFGESNRAFSHGCIRLAEAEKMANYLLQTDTAWNPTKVKQAMNAGIEQFVTLKIPRPVYIVYFTSWVDSHGKLNFRKDVYDRDKRLANMLLNKTE